MGNSFTGTLATSPGAVVTATAVSPADAVNADWLALVQGDDHTEGDRLPTWALTGYTGPSLTGGTAVVRLTRTWRYLMQDPLASSCSAGYTADIEVVAAVAQAGTTVTVTAPITAAQSAALSPVRRFGESTHQYQLIATTAAGKPHTLAFGSADVAARIPPQ